MILPFIHLAARETTASVNVLQFLHQRFDAGNHFFMGDKDRI